MTFSILYPDMQFDDEPSIETAVFGDGAKLTIFKENAAPGVPENVWRECDAIIAYHFQTIDAAIVAKLDRCKLIVRAGVGFDQIDIDACAQRGIPVCNTPDYGTTDVADHAIALILGLARGIVAFNNSLLRDVTTGWNFLAAPTVRRLSNQTCGIVGLGRIGTATALRAKAFGMNVVFYDPFRPTGVELSLGIRRSHNLQDLLAQSDIVSVHTPLTDETRGLFNSEIIAQMKQGSFLVNTARGSIIELDAVLAALRAGKIGGAALDVLPNEPPDANEELVVAWQREDQTLRDRLILTPHCAFYSPSSILDLRRKSAATAVAYLFKGELKNCINGLDIIASSKL